MKLLVLQHNRLNSKHCATWVFFISIHVSGYVPKRSFD